MLRFNVIPAPESIAHFVRYFWVLEGDASEREPYLHRALADSCPEFLFYYKGSFKSINKDNKLERCFRSGIYGQTQSYVQYQVNEDFGIFGVYLYPYAISQLFSLPASELSDQKPDLSTLCGKAGEILEEKVMLASSNLQRATLVTEFLIKRLVLIKTEYTYFQNIINKVIASNQFYDIADLAFECNLSRRQYERKFMEYSGFSPRAFLNLVRFGHVLNSTSIATKPLTEIAYNYGYYDQSHFIRHFRKFSGYSPKEYFKNTDQDTNYKASSEFRF